MLKSLFLSASFLALPAQADILFTKAECKVTTTKYDRSQGGPVSSEVTKEIDLQAPTQDQDRQMQFGMGIFYEERLRYKVVLTVFSSEKHAKDLIRTGVMLTLESRDGNKFRQVMDAGVLHAWSAQREKYNLDAMSPGFFAREELCEGVDDRKKCFEEKFEKGSLQDGQIHDVAVICDLKGPKN